MIEMVPWSVFPRIMIGVGGVLLLMLCLFLAVFTLWARRLDGQIQNQTEEMKLLRELVMTVIRSHLDAKR